VRARLTTLYGMLFLLSGAVLLGITYVLVDDASLDEHVTILFPDGSSVGVSAEGAEEVDGGSTRSPSGRTGPLTGAESGPGVPDPERVRDIVAGQQEHLIDALLTLARGQAGTDRSEPIDLARVVSDATAARRADAEATGLTVLTDLSPARALGDPRLIERLVSNLVDNATRHYHSGGTVHLTTATRDGCPTLAVANTGPIVPDDALADLVEPIRRLDTHRIHRSDGHGLGLSIVKAVADAHRATLRIDPRSGGGLHVEVVFQEAVDA